MRLRSLAQGDIKDIIPSYGQKNIVYTLMTERQNAYLLKNNCNNC